MQPPPDIFAGSYYPRCTDLRHQVLNDQTASQVQAIHTDNIMDRRMWRLILSVNYKPVADL